MTATAPQMIPLIESLTQERNCGLGILAIIHQLKPQPLPLAEVALSARVADRIASVEMTQQFQNPYSEHLEAVYTFPLPGSAVVNSFELRVGDRIIRGKVKERREAREEYQAAVEAGRRAALLEQERDDVFTMQIGNLPPGETITVRLTYSAQLPFFEDGTTEMRLPLVVAPRYVPGKATGKEPVGTGIAEDTDLVPDASRISPPRLAKGFDPQVNCRISVELVRLNSLGEREELADLFCSQHAIRTVSSHGAVLVSLAREGERLDRDFVLRWRMAGTEVRSRLLVHRDEQGNRIGLLSVIAPRQDVFLGTPRDVVFVVDRSGSMEGLKMNSAARACSCLLNTLGPRDRFAILAFDDRMEWVTLPQGRSGDNFWQADQLGIERGEALLRKINSRGGTELDKAMQTAITAFQKTRQRSGRIPVIVLLTDGQISDESRVLKRIQQEIGEARVFTVGIDTAVNETFLRRLATLGGGTATFVEPGTQLEDALRLVGQEIGTPLLLDLKVTEENSGSEPSQLAPARLPDLFAGRAVTGFFPVKNKGRIRISGTSADGRAFSEMLEPQEVEVPALAQLWAKARVVDLEDRFRTNQGKKADVRKEIIALSVTYSILTKFTAFVVVDETEVVNPDGTRKRVVQPVAMPDLWQMGAQSAPDPGTGLTRACTSVGAPPPAQGARLRGQGVPMSKAEGFMPGALPPPPPSPPPMAAPAVMPPTKGGGLMDFMEEVVDSVSGAIGGIFQPSAEKAGKPSRPKPQPPVPDMMEMERERSIPNAAPPVRAQDFDHVFTEFMNVFASVRTELETDRVPRWEELEQSRKRLLAVLALSDLGLQLSGLQRFLRAAVVEILAALQTPGVTFTVLVAVFERHRMAFEALQYEVAPFLQTKSGKPQQSDDFWESSI
ncbi:MAG: VIT and VWA domain-containing protein [Blastocatellia bacterium]|nr:VIT and VWA domain-containing protein [Blastocatellia bacterium]